MKVFSEGTVFAGRFRLLSRLAANPRTQVWKVADTAAADAPLALKMYISEKQLDGFVLELLREEFRTMAIRHQHVHMPVMFDVLDGVPCLIGPLIPGGSLADALHRSPGTPALDEVDTVDCLRQISSALAYLHRKNYVHQDISASNVLLSGVGMYQLADFGLNRILHNSLGHSAGPNRIIHVPYASPECFRGVPASSSDDIFSLGVLIYEIVTGSAPWEGRGGQALLDGGGPLELGPEFSDEFADLLRQCTARTPEKRPDATALEKWTAAYVPRDSATIIREREETVQRLREEMEERERATAAALARAEAERKQREAALEKVREMTANKRSSKHQTAEDAERKAREDAERQAREDAERQAREDAERKAREDAERKAREDAERTARQDAERKAREDAERKAREDAERKAREDAERKARQDAERKAREDAERKAREDAERKAREDAKRKAREDAERKAHEDADRKAREDAERKAREDAERKARAQQTSEAQAYREREAQLLREAEISRRAQVEAEALARALRKQHETELELMKEHARRLQEELERTKVAQTDMLVQERAERTAREHAERVLRLEVERKLREKAERDAREKAEREAREKIDHEAHENIERAAREAAERSLRQESERILREEAERIFREEAERKLREEDDLRARIEAEYKAKIETERLARLEAEERLRREQEERASASLLREVMSASADAPTDQTQVSVFSAPAEPAAPDTSLPEAPTHQDATSPTPESEKDASPDLAAILDSFEFQQGVLPELVSADAMPPPDPEAMRASNEISAYREHAPKPPRAPSAEVTEVAPEPDTAQTELWKEPRASVRIGTVVKALVTVAILAAAGWWFFGRSVAPEEVVLRIEAPVLPDARLLPDLIEGWFRAQGASSVSSSTQDGVSTFRAAFGDTVRIVRLRTDAPKQRMARLGSGESDLMVMTRPLTRDEMNSVGNLASWEAEHCIALSAVAFVVHSSNPLARIDLGAAIRAMRGDVKDWKELGGRRGTVQLLFPPAESAEDEMLRGALQSVDVSPASAHRATGIAELLKTVESDPSALGILPVGAALGHRVLAVDDGINGAVAPDRVQILSGRYPLVTALFAYTHGAESGRRVASFLAFAQSEAGQKIAAAAGWIGQGVEFVPDILPRSAPAAYRDAVRGARRVAFDIHLRPGSTDLDDRARADLARLAAYLHANQRTVVVIGFSDRLGSSESERIVAASLASKVEKQLRNSGVTPSLVLPLGSIRPIASDDSPDGRDRNRRAEIWLR